MMDFLSGGFGFIMSLYETLEVPLCDIFHIQAFFPSLRQDVYALSEVQDHGCFHTLQSLNLYFCSIIELKYL